MIPCAWRRVCDRREQDAFFIVEPNRTQLDTLARMIDAGELPLAEARRAYEHKPVHGKVVLTIAA